jgi:hypothetical protein
MYPQHERALAKAQDRLLQTSDILAILLGGSIAKHSERPDSDVDLIVVVTDEDYARRRAAHQVGFLWTDVADYAGGYVEGRFISRRFLLDAAERGSEPTRHSFTGVTALHCTDAAITAALPRIPVYPEHDRQRRIESFYAQCMLYRWFFWPEGVRRNDPYLKLRGVTGVALFGARWVLAENRTLFPCQKRLAEILETCPDKPANCMRLFHTMLAEQSDEAREAFCNALVEHFGAKPCDLLSLFLEDVEMAWFTQMHDVGEW